MGGYLLTTRSITPSGENRMPQGVNGNTKTIKFIYVGDLPNLKYLSLVDASLNNNNPCVQGTEAAGDNIDNQHSGANQASTGKEVTFNFGGNNPFSVSKTYTFCYAETSGLTDDATWRDSYIRIQVSKLESLASHDITHVTDGSIARTTALEMVYDGTLGASMWLSFIDATLNNNFPC